MSRVVRLAAALLFGAITPAAAQEPPSYDFRERTRALAFDPARFFPDRVGPAMAIRYMGDDYGYPVHAIAVRTGCTDGDKGKERAGCGTRMTARMLRSPYPGEPPRPRDRGRKLFEAIARSDPSSDDALRRLLDDAGLEWREADIRKCPAALAHLATARNLRFSPFANLTSQRPYILLHADNVTVEINRDGTQSRYAGWLKHGSPAEWADRFAKSLENCWKPSAAPTPWRVTDR